MTNAAHFVDITIRSTSHPDEPPRRERINYARRQSQEYVRKMIHGATMNGMAVHIEAMRVAEPS